MKNILLTGATGLLGSKLLKLFLAEDDAQIFLLIRGVTRAEAENRAERLLSNITLDMHSRQKYIEKIKVIWGDITKENLGTEKKDYSFLANDINEVFHCAALTRFNAPYNRLKEINVVGTKRILRLIGESEKIRALNYVSTVFICGNYKGDFSERQFDERQVFNNDYEKSKFEAEFLVRNFQSNKVVKKIYRPSIIVGESAHELKKAGLLTQFFNMLLSGFHNTLPVDEKTLINVIPNDVAAEMIFNISSQHALNGIYHIINPRNFLLRDFIDLGCKYFDCIKPRLVNLSEFNFNKVTQIERVLLNTFISYINLKAILSSQITMRCLENKRIDYSYLNENFILKTLKRTVRINRFKEN